MAALVPLSYSSVHKQWHSEVFQYDASLRGYGVVSATVPLDLVKETGRLKERYRFKGFHRCRAAPRAQSLAAGIGVKCDEDTILDVEDKQLHTLSDEGIACLGTRVGFREVPKKLIEGRKWKVD